MARNLQERKSMRNRKNKLPIATILASLVAVIIFGLATGSAVDAHFDNQDTMLCNSAKVSGNEEYLKKCSCFYNGENIRCMYKEEK